MDNDQEPKTPCPVCKGVCQWCGKEYADCECSHDEGNSWPCDECNDWGF